MSTWTGPAQTARCLGNRIGEDATLRRTVKGAYDPVLGTEGASTVTDYSITIKDVKFERTGFDPTTIESGDRFIGVPAADLSITPDIETDSVVIDGEAWFLKGYKTKRLGDTVMSYMFHVKR